MKKFQKKALSGLAISVSAAALLAGGSAFAQDASQDEVEEEEIVLADAGATGQEEDRIVVTGSRVRRADTFSSISPLQILSTEAARDVGEFDAAEILQRSEFASGQQIDATFQGFVLNNGPGSQTLDLRGLGADRTLLMINSRRLAPSGVEGAPTNPSINLLPTSLIARYDLLLDGASSIYGSDAVAGVGNIILRDDLDGFEVFASGNLNEQGGGDDYTISGSWGKSFSNGFFGIGAEYARRDEVLLGDRDFLAGCDTHFEVDQDGNFHTNDVRTNALTEQQSGGTIRTTVQPCKLDRLTGRIQANQTRLGSIYYDTRDFGLGVPGNTGIPFFSEETDAFGLPVDRDGDGLRDVDLSERTRNGKDLDVSFISPQDTYNVMAYGEYTFEGDLNITPFFEAMYSRAEVKVENSGVPQFFPWVPASNIFSPCNITTANGVDCRSADNAFQGFTDGVPPALATGTSVATRPIPSIRGDRNNVETVQEHYRGVLGVRGDLPFINDSWNFEVSGVYSRSEGSSIRRGIRADRLAHALGIDPTGDFNNDGEVDFNGDGIADDYISQPVSPMLADGACGTAFANPNLLAPDIGPGCVPVNLFAESLFFPGPIGDLATQAERDYLFGERTFDTTYEQIVLSGFVSGEVIELPAGPLSLVLGVEYREDTINSQPDFVAANGLFWGFFADSGAQGSKYIMEGFGELNIPVFDDDFWGQFEVNASGRITDEEFYGTEGTYSIKGGWQPIPQLLLKASYGTSFRAPNLRENFLAGQSGFGNITDPCAVPQTAYDSINDVFLPQNDTRDPVVLANCRREGRDPTRVGIQPGINSLAVQSAEITSGGSLELDPETSTSFTTGFGLTESFGGLDASFNFNYYAIVVKGAIDEPTGQSIVNDCFLRDDPERSRLCDFIGFDGDTTGRQLINSVFAGFVNVNRETVRGIDLNATFGYDIPMGGEVLGLDLNMRANHLIERSTTELDDQGNPDFDEDAGEFGFPSWTGRATLTASYSDFAFTWQTRWIGDTQQQADGIDPLSDAWGYNAAGEFTGFFSDTCLGNGSRDALGNLDGIVAGDGRFCSDVGFADDYFVHTASVRYNLNERIVLRAGVTNLFDKDPPLIDTNEVFGVSNISIGNGFDLNGREFFGSLNVKF